MVYLGANTPLTHVEQTAAAIKPDLIVLAAQQLQAAAAVREAALRFDLAGIHLAYGGLIFNRVPEIRSQIPALYLGEELRSAAGRIELLLENPSAFPEKSSRKNPTGKKRIFSGKTYPASRRLSLIY